MKGEFLKQIIVFITVSLCLSYAASSVVLAESITEETELDDYGPEFEDVVYEYASDDDDDYADAGLSDDFYEEEYEEEDTVLLGNEDEDTVLPGNEDEDTDLIESLDEEGSSSTDSEPEVLEDVIFEDITDSTVDEEAAALAASDRKSVV